MTTNDNEDHLKWIAARKKTFTAFCLISFGLGFELAIILPSVFVYIKEVIGAKHPNIWYGLTLSSYPTGSIIGAFTVLKYADKTRRTRQVMLILLTFEIIGNIIYALPYSTLCPMFGRFLSGFGDVGNMIIAGEILRVYDDQELTSRIAWTTTCFAVGFTVSPGVNILFVKLDFYIGPFHVLFGNMPGLFMAVYFAIVSVVSSVIISDVSGIYDLKKEKEKNRLPGHKNDKNEYGSFHDDDSFVSEETDKLLHKKKSDNTNKHGNSGVLNSMLCQFDLTFLLVFCFLCSFNLFSFATLIPLMASNYLHLKVTGTSVLFLSAGFSYVLILFIIAKLSKKVSEFYIIICVTLVMLLTIVTILCFSLYHGNVYFNYACMAIFILGSQISFTVEEVLTKALFGKLLPSSCQSYAEGIRRSVTNVAFIISGVVSAGLFKYLPIVSSTLFVATCALLGVFIHRRGNFRNPVPLFYLEGDE